MRGDWQGPGKMRPEGAWPGAKLAIALLSTGLMTSTALTQIGPQISPPSVASPPAEAASETPAEGDMIMVTGTRIKRPNLESNSPVTVIDRKEIMYQGATTAEGILNRLPQVTADANENVSNGSDGTAGVNLRDLGASRTLVLLNGQRLLPTQAVDLNFVPTALIDRVDVVTGGASAVYGSDAIAGVVNFILRDSFEGVHIDSQYGFNQHDNGNDYARGLIDDAGYQQAKRHVTDGGRVDVNISAGTNFADGRGNVTMYGGYRKVNSVSEGSRDYSACAVDPTGEGNTDLTCGGSSNNAYGLFTLLTGPNAGTTYNNTKDGAKTWVPYNNSFIYNTSPDNYIQRSDARYTGGAFAKYEISPAVELYGSFMFMDDHTFSQVASSALFQGTTFSINCDNPLLGASQANQLCGSAAGTNVSQDTFIGYRLTGDGSAPRRDDLRHTDYRYTAGVRGKIADGITYDASYLRSKVIYDETYSNNVDNRKAANALQVVNVNGVPTCKSVIDGSDPKCVPIDVFGAGNIDPSAYSYLYSPSSTHSVSTENVISGSISADLKSYGIVSPWANDGVALAVGVEHRRESLLFTADEVAQANGTTNSQGQYHVNEVYGELEIPILQDVPFAHALTINGGYRLSNYSSLDKNISTYKFELQYSPVRAVRFRASYNHAIRAPNITELFAGQQLGNVSARDPCSGGSPTATLAQCQNTGVTAAQYGHVPDCPSDTCVTQSGGNPNLKPETADTYTAGVVLTPTQIPGLSLSVDYFHIKVKDYISTVDPTLVINQCVQTGDPYFCGLFHRDSRTGVLFGENGYIVATTLNTGYLKTAGVDVTAAYALDLSDIGHAGLGRVDFNLVGSFLDKREIEQLPGLGSYDCKGLFGPTCGQPTPAWRHQFRATWSPPWSKATVSAAWRYIGSAKLSNNEDNPFLAAETFVINRKIKAYNYFDLAATVEVHKDIVLRAGCNNLMDKDPPQIAQGLLTSFGNGNTYPGVYDPLGRTLFVGLSANF